RSARTPRAGCLRNLLLPRQDVAPAPSLAALPARAATRPFAPALPAVARRRGGDLLGALPPPAALALGTRRLGLLRRNRSARSRARTAWAADRRRPLHLPRQYALVRAPRGRRGVDVGERAQPSPHPDHGSQWRASHPRGTQRATDPRLARLAHALGP